MYQNGKNIIIIDRNVNCVDALLGDIRKTKPLSPEEESKLWEQMQQGSQRARARLIESNMRYAVSVATFDFARRYCLNEQQMSRLLDIISQELCHTTMAA